MAYFIVIGTDNNVKTVVDEIRESHLQHNVVTSGCVVNQDDSLFYHWDVYNAKGDKQGEDKKPSISLRDALTNQIAQFKTLLPHGAIPNVFLIGGCYTEEDSKRMKFVYDSLCEIGGANLKGLSIDIVLMGYNLSLPDDVTLTPNWKILRNVAGIENGRFPTDVLYINNMDYDGAATNIDARLLGRFLGHWAKMESGDSVNPKQSVQTNHYAIGMAERQYIFDDLVRFFMLAAEERILERALHDEPSPATQQMLDKKYFSEIDLDKPWIDGLRHIYDIWKSYCANPFDYKKGIEEQPYSLSVQKEKLTLYFNNWFEIYCKQQQRDKESYEQNLDRLNHEIKVLKSSLNVDQMEDGDNSSERVDSSIKEELKEKEKERDELEFKISNFVKNIEKNTFADARLIKEDLATGLLTISQKKSYETHIRKERDLWQYMQTDCSVEVINEAAVRAVKENEEFPICPQEVIDNVGRLEEIIFNSDFVPSASTSIAELSTLQEKRSGCIGRIWRLFHREDKIVDPSAKNLGESEDSSTISHDHTSSTTSDQYIKHQIVSAITEFRRVKEVEDWWNKLLSLIESKTDRQKECLNEMENYKVPFHRKSISIIEMDKVKHYRDNDSNYLSMISKIKELYFDSSIDDSKRLPMSQLVDQQIIKPLRNNWQILFWNGSNPFCDELNIPGKIHDFIEDDLENGTHKQSKIFVEYVKLGTQNITQNVNYLFYFSHPQVERQPNEFRVTYRVSEGSLSPVYMPDFINSLCEVQVLNVTDYVDNLADFRPRTEAMLHESRINYSKHVHEIVGSTTSVKDKAKAIYNWLCNNIAYDTTYQIHEADRCWETKRGVCQAYCELFVHLAKQVGVTAEIISGKSKSSDGKISDKDHAWIFVYTLGYDGIFIDPTWGAGHVMDGKFVADSNDTWFDVDPDWLAFTHYANDEEWNEKSSTKITYEQFAKLPFMLPLKHSGSNTLFEAIEAIAKL